MTSRLRSRPAGPEEERLFDLMRERALFGLEDDALRELNRLAAAHQDLDVECYDRAAAALDLGWSQGRCAPMPAALRANIRARAPQPATARAAPDRRGSLTPAPAPAAPRALGPVAWAGWVVGAAATVVAVLGWMRAPAAPDTTLLAQALQHDVDAAKDCLVLPWKPTDDPDGRGVSGELHWSTALQKGYMRFRGLPSNDPRAKQYQLWIFDKPRGADHPVDGGVFDVAAGGEVVVPIDAKIQVFEPSLFAVTAEPPGGVVVSKREHVVSLAQL